ncbi:MAG TPA: alpha/beta hydrolase [Bacteroidia bacterium]|jgi:pimeloyl-ACP methyl ester carboxylesterase|nr:alpha/beta hydrolase [Bacteroidia bacterium]
MKLTHIFFLSAFVAIALVAGMFANSKVSDKMRKAIYGSNPIAGKFYAVNGIQLYCETYGSGDPLLMIHGNGGDITAFSNQIPFFSKHYKVIVVDSRAQGKSVDPSDSLTYEQMADDFAALLTALNVDSANVLGWSDGGINGLLLAMRHPDKVKKLAITGANLEPDTNAVDPAIINEIMPYYQESKKESQAKALKNNMDSTKFKLLRLLMEQPHIRPADLQKISCPVLVIGGDHDLIRPKHTLQIFEHIPKAYLWIVPNSGHGTLIEHVTEFNEQVHQFYKTPFQDRGKLSIKDV